MTVVGRILLILVLLTVPAALRAQQATPDPSDEGDDHWITRNLERYFGGGDQQAENLEGRAEEVSSEYLKHAGKPIEVVIVHQVASFKDGWNEGKSTATKLLDGVTSPFQSYTRDGIIRDYLLFEQGQKLDPFALADSEVLLRQLPYINDVRILVVPLLGEIESVAIVVETTDRWPFGVNGKIVTAEKYNVDLYSENVGGLGIRFHNRILHDSLEDPVWGYRGQLSKDNIEGTFWGAAFEVEDSFDRRRKILAVNRRLAHVGLHWVGGASLERHHQFGSGREPSRYNHFDTWGGDVIRLDGDKSSRNTSRTILVPALRYFQRDHDIRPVVHPDSNRSYHDREVLLAGVTLQRFKTYKTSYLFGDGETEDFPVGFSAQLAGGYERREFQERVPVALELGWTSFDSSGKASYLRAHWGAYWYRSKPEEGVLQVRLGHTGRLFHLGEQRMRILGEIFYTLGSDRFPHDRIYLDDDHGVRNLEKNEVEGNQRLAGSLEGRLFSTVSLLGFRFSFYGYADTGLIGSEEASSIFKEKMYVSTGVGVRLRNPSLVFPTFQMQLSFLSNIDTPGMAISFKLGNVHKRQWSVPGTRPGLPSYD